MTRIDLRFSDHFEKRFRDAVLRVYGWQGNLTVAAVEAIEMWMKEKAKVIK